MSERLPMIVVPRRYRNLVKETDRWGNRRLYFRVGKGLRIRIREEIGTAEFEERYRGLARRHEAGELKPAPKDAPARGTLRWLGVQYVSSAEFLQLAPVTQHVTRLILDDIYREPRAPSAQEVFGDCPLSRFDAEAVGIIRDRKASTPEAANNRLKRLRTMFKWAALPKNKSLGITSNPARDVSRLAPRRAGGFPVWKPADLDKFEERHPIGTTARLALDLLMFTGARRSDVVLLGPPMVRDGALTWTPYKGRNGKRPVECSILIQPELRATIDATAVVGTTTWLVTQYGRPFTPEGFGNKMAEWCRQADLPGKNSHGVRKAAATRLAQRGASTHMLMATFGWLSIAQAELYTRDVERKRLSHEASPMMGTKR